MLNQKERQPLSVAEQVASIYAGTGGYLDRIKTGRVHEFLDDLLSRLKAEQAALMNRITETGELSDDDERQLGEAIGEMVDDFGPDFDAEGNPLEEGESERVVERARAGAAPGERAEQEAEEAVEAREAEEVPA